MKRTTQAGVGVAAILLLGLGAGALLYFTRLDTEIAAGIEAHFERSTGTEATVGRVDLSLGETRGTLTGFTIANPPGYETPYALRIEGLDIVIDPVSFTGEVPVIREISVTGATLNAEQRGDTANVVEILEHMRRTDDVETADAEERIIVDAFRLENASIVVTAESLGDPESLMLDPIEIRDIGRASGGATYGEATDQVLSSIFAAARDAMNERIRSAAGSAIREEAEEALRERLDELRE